VRRRHSKAAPKRSLLPVVCRISRPARSLHVRVSSGSTSLACPSRPANPCPPEEIPPFLPPRGRHSVFLPTRGQQPSSSPQHCLLPSSAASGRLVDPHFLCRFQGFYSSTDHRAGSHLTTLQTIDVAWNKQRIPHHPPLLRIAIVSPVARRLDIYSTRRRSLCLTTYHTAQIFRAFCAPLCNSKTPCDCAVPAQDHSRLHLDDRIRRRPTRLTPVLCPITQSSAPSGWPRNLAYFF
jgi:hypothetical protein